MNVCFNFWQKLFLKQSILLEFIIQRNKFLQKIGYTPKDDNYGTKAMQLSPAGPPRVKKFAQTPPPIPKVQRQEAKLTLKPKLNLLPSTKGRVKKFENIMKDMMKKNKEKESKHYYLKMISFNCDIKFFILNFEITLNYPPQNF